MTRQIIVYLGALGILITLCALSVIWSLTRYWEKRCEFEALRVYTNAWVAEQQSEYFTVSLEEE